MGKQKVFHHFLRMLNSITTVKSLVSLFFFMDVKKQTYVLPMYLSLFLCIQGHLKLLPPFTDIEFDLKQSWSPISPYTLIAQY